MASDEEAVEPGKAGAVEEGDETILEDIVASRKRPRVDGEPEGMGHEGQSQIFNGTAEDYPQEEEVQPLDEDIANLDDLRHMRRQKEYDENGEEIFDMDNITEDEENERRLDDVLEMGGEFSKWLGGEAHVQTTGRKATNEDVELELQRMGYTERQQQMISTGIPERLQEIDIQTRGKFPIGEKQCEIDRHAEACWIISRLVLPPLSPLSGDVELTQAIKRGRWTHPIVLEVERVLQLLHTEFIEPSRMMIDYASEFPVLHKALWSTKRIDALKNGAVSASAAYCTKTGRRQLPRVVDDRVVFSIEAAYPTGSDDTAVPKPVPQAQRKPADLLLGRLLWTIADLDFLLHGFERTRQGFLSGLTPLAPASQSIQWCTNRLEETVFETAFDAAAWQRYTTHCQRIFSPQAQLLGSSYGTIIALNLTEAFEQYSLSPYQFAENIQQGRIVHPLPTSLPNNQSPQHWAGAVGDKVNRGYHSVLQLFNNAIVEMLAAHPFVLKVVYDAFRVFGVCKVSSGPSEDVYYRIADIFERNPSKYSKLMEEQSTGNCRVKLEVGLNDLRDALKHTQLFEDSGSPLAEARSRVGPTLVAELVDFVRRQLDSELKIAAEEMILRRCQESLAKVVMAGPYEQSTLNLTGFPKQAPPLWEPEWNCVEAVRRDDAYLTAGQARICGVYRGENNVTTFACCDENGTLQGEVRWVDCAEQTADGQRVANHQKEQLLALLDRCETNAIAVVVTGADITDLMRQTERFVRETVMPKLRYQIPVFLCPPEVPLAFCWSSAANKELPHVDTGLRTAISCARFFRDPLLETCRVFSVPKDGLTLPIGGIYTANPRKVVLCLQREMSLWVGAVGFEANMLMRQPSPEDVLQFVPGLGPFKAKYLARQIEESCKGVICSRKQLVELLVGQDAVGACAIPSLRVFLPSRGASEGGADGAHILDATLIPAYLYGPAERLAAEAIGKVGWSGARAIAKLWSLTKEKRFQCLTELPLEALSQTVGVSKDTVSFLVDELLAAGTSSVRRVFRNMSSATFLRLSTGVTWIGSRALEGAAYDEDEGTVLGENDLVQAVPVGCKPVPTPSLRLRTEFGISAVMAARDIDDPKLRQAVVDHVANTVGNSTRLPASIAHQPTIWGRIKEINATRCEMRLAWAPAPTLEAAAGAIMGLPGAHDESGQEETQSVKTIQTIRWTNAARTNATKISRHPLFRNIDIATADDRVGRSLIGEYLLCPSSQDVRRVYFVLKVGEQIKPLHIPVREFHRSDGTVAYEYTNARTSTTLEFQDPDHCFATFIEKLLQNVQMLRTHSNFLPTATREEVLNALDLQEAQQQSSKRQIPFAITENVDDYSHTAHVTPYVVHYQARPGTVKRIRLVVEDKLFMRYASSSENNGRATYVKCTTVEDVMKTLNKLLKQRRRE